MTSSLSGFRTWVWLGLLALLCPLLAVLAMPAQGSADASARQVDARPNIVLITTDDQTLAEMGTMPLTRSVLGDAGVTFTQGISPHPLCCPARAEILTGQYGQNNGVINNQGVRGGYDALKDRDNTVARWVHDAGYRTAFVGKFLNLYEVSDGQPAGWDRWEPFVGGVYSGFGYTALRDWTRVPPDGVTHSNDYVTGRTLDFVREWAGDGAPFFIWSSYVAPHGQCGADKIFDKCNAPPAPAARHQNLFFGATNPSRLKPSFNERDVRDKPDLIKRHSSLAAAKLAGLYRARQRSLASVDEGVAALVNELAVAGELDNTVIMFTSDNGYLLGEHRYTGKNLPYLESIQVPFLIRGPGLPAGVRRTQQVATIDLAPTITELAGAVPGRVMDGQSMIGPATSSTPLTRTLLVQAGPPPWAFADWSYRGVHVGRYTYVRWQSQGGFEELYDHAEDPYELVNVAHDPRYGRVRLDLARRTKALVRCAGASCRTAFGPPPRPQRWAG